MIKRLIGAHRFFIEKSPHYLFDNYKEYKKYKREYYFNFSLAYVRFMWYTIKDEWKGYSWKKF
jgi:hypothetical protein